LPKIKYQHIVNKLLDKPVFTFKDLVLNGIPYNYAKRLAYLLLSKGKIKRIEKGKYATVNDPFLIAPFTVFPCYITMHSALYLNKILQQIPFTVEIATTRRKKHQKIVFEGIEIRYYRIKRRDFFGFRYIPYDAFKIPVAYTEKALIDIFYFNQYPVGSIDLERLDRRVLRSYLYRMNMESLTNKVLGWLDAEYKRA